jgi:hypothetical protein
LRCLTWTQQVAGRVGIDWKSTPLRTKTLRVLQNIEPSDLSDGGREFFGILVKPEKGAHENGRVYLFFCYGFCRRERL